MFIPNKIDMSLLLASNNKNICRSISTKLHYLNTIVSSINCIDLWAWLDKITSWFTRLYFYVDNIYVHCWCLWLLWSNEFWLLSLYNTTKLQQAVLCYNYYSYLYFLSEIFFIPFIQSTRVLIFPFLRFPFDPP